MRRYVTRATNAESTDVWRIVLACFAGRARCLAFGGHGVFEGTFGGPVVAAADSALDLCVLEDGLLARHLACVLIAGLPVACGSEGDVLGDGGGVCLWAQRFPLLGAELGPVFSLCDARVDDLLDGYFLDAARGLYFFAIFPDRVGDNGLGTVFVFGDLLLGEGDGVVVFFFRPVGAAVGVSGYF
jgi:hypothetical protein